MKMLLLSLALGAPFATPVADVVPTWNVEASCNGAVSADKSENVDDVQTVAACMNDEKQAHDELAKNWTSYAAPLRTTCEGEASGNGLNSYVDLIVCLQTFSDPGNKPPTAVNTASLKGSGKHRRKTPAK
jgi:hypothetical protein